MVITSVDRDDLRDGGAQHFVDVHPPHVRELSPTTTIETLVPDFRGRMEIALDVLGGALPDVLNHNLETVPRLYKQARPGADYTHSLEFLKQFKARYPHVSTKSGLMVGLGETDEEILEVMRDLRAHDVEMLTIGQYLAPSGHHLPVSRYVHAGNLQDVRGRSEKNGLHRRRLCADGAFNATGPTSRRTPPASPETEARQSNAGFIASRAREPMA